MVTRDGGGESAVRNGDGESKSGGSAVSVLIVFC